MRFPGVVLGFHGCDRVVAERILAGKDDVRTSKNPHDWLASSAVKVRPLKGLKDMAG